jgi:hypothetical protein
MVTTPSGLNEQADCSYHSTFPTARDIADSNSLANLAGELLRERDTFYCLAVLMRRAGATIRPMAKSFEISKSEMGRLMPLIDIGVSQLGQGSIWIPEDSPLEPSHQGTRALGGLS